MGRGGGSSEREGIIQYEWSSMMLGKSEQVKESQTSQKSFLG